MHYHLIALWAVAVLAVALPTQDQVIGRRDLTVLDKEPNNGGDSSILSIRSSDSTGVQDAKSSEIGDLINDAASAGNLLSDVSSLEDEINVAKDLLQRDNGVKHGRRDENLDVGLPSLVAPVDVGIPIIDPEI